MTTAAPPNPPSTPAQSVAPSAKAQPAAAKPPPRPGNPILNVILGKPLASNEKEGVKIGVLSAVPAMGLDALSSSSYGPEAALTILLPLGAVGLGYLTPIMLAIVSLLVLLYLSYRQTIQAYPVSGGSYTVASENLGVWPGLIAAAALMIDYLLNVAVGISAGVAALVSAAPSLHHYTLPLCLAILAVITLLNLRGTGEAGAVFAIPTYIFMASLLGVVATGVVKTIISGGHPHAVLSPPPIPRQVEAVSLWLLLRAFASGCTAMTGVEAVSNGVGAFIDPPVPRAHRTLTVIVVILTLLLVGIAFLAHVYGIAAMDQEKPGYQSVVSQMLSAIIGRGWIYYVSISSVLAVLCLSANTSFVGFPRLCRLIAGDDFLPRAFAVSGRRLVYSAGVLALASAAAALLIGFRGITDRLIPLFAVGAFLAFTLSQTGMVVHWHREMRSDKRDAKEGGNLRLRLWINGVGAVATAVALAIILAAKFIEGAWISVLAIPILLTVFKLIHRHYQKVNQQTTAYGPLELKENHAPVVLVPTKGWNRITGKALRFAMWMSSDVIALHLCNLSGDEANEEEGRVREAWETNVAVPVRNRGLPVPRLDIAQAPYRSIVGPVMREVDRLKQEFPSRLIAVVTPELVEKHWWESLLHRRQAQELRSALLKSGDHRVILIHVPWFVQE